MPQNRLWLNTAALAIEFLLVMSGVALALNWLLRPLRKLVAATDRFGRTQEITPLRTDSGPVEVREAGIRVQQDVFEYSAIIRGTGTLPDSRFRMTCAPR